MSNFDELHEEAMDLAERGESLRKMDLAGARQVYSKALELELKALRLLNTEDKLTRAVVLRSAAALAVGAENYREARWLVEDGKKIAPPEIVAELEVLLGSVPAEAKPRFNPKHLTNVPAPGDYKPLWQTRNAA
jgi:hypothetical protein